MIKYTIDEIADRFDEAVYTLKRLPPVRVPSYFNSWPQILHSTAERLQADKKTFKLGPPSALAITRMEECLEWVMWLEEEEERHVVWMRAQNICWKLICRKIGYGRTKAWQIYCCALLKIVTRLNTRMLAGLHVRTKNQ